MSVRVWLVALVACGWLWPTIASAQSAPACQVASDRDGLAVTVAVLGSPGLQLRVDWGDGAFDVARRPTGPGRGRAFLRHEYASAGTYAIRATATTPSGAGCAVDLVAQLPATT
jgi:hypothetical protein